MEKILFLFALLFISIISFAQVQPNSPITVQKYTTAFIYSKSMGTLVVCLDSSAIYELTAQGTPSGTLATTANVKVGGSMISTLYTWLNPVTSFRGVLACTAPDTAVRYIASVTGGGWTVNRIYECNGTTWTETIPTVGNAVVVIDSSKIFVYTVTGWSKYFQYQFR